MTLSSFEKPCNLVGIFVFTIIFLMKKKEDLLVAERAEIGILIPTSNVRSEPVGKIIERFFRECGIFSSSLTASSEVVVEIGSALLADLNCKPLTL